MGKVLLGMFLTLIALVIFLRWGDFSSKEEKLKDGNERKVHNDKKNIINNWGKESNGLVSRISICNIKEVSLKQSILIKYEIKNISKVTISIWHRGFWPNQKIVVLDENKNEPQMTEYGLIRRNAFQSSNESGKNFEVKLNPGDIYDNFTEYELNSFFLFRKKEKILRQIHL